MKVFKEEQEFGTSYFLEQDEKYLKIIYGGNLDLYWHFINKKARRENESAYENVYETMLITKENYTIYQLFSNLLTEAKKCEVYKAEEIIPEPTWDGEFDVRDVYPELPFFTELSEEDEISLTNAYKAKKATEVNSRLKNSSEYKSLVQNDSIVWYSDDNEKSKADIVRISETEEGILLEFTRPNLDPKKDDFHFPGTLTIRFSNSGSRYGELVNLFTRMYNNLYEYEPEYHQIHLEELAYQRKLTLEKKDK